MGTGLESVALMPSIEANFVKKIDPRNNAIMLFIIVIVLSINFVGDGLRDAFDPTQTRVRA